MPIFEKQGQERRQRGTPLETTGEGFGAADVVVSVSLMAISMG
jgi:hypothetical protein